MDLKINFLSTTLFYNVINLLVFFVACFACPVCDHDDPLQLAKLSTVYKITTFPSYFFVHHTCSNEILYLTADTYYNMKKNQTHKKTIEEKTEILTKINDSNWASKTRNNKN
jgi:hypothetical protein